MADCTQYAVEDEVELLANVLGEEPQHQVAVLLQHLILAAVASIGNRIGEVLSAIQLHCDPRIGAKQVDFQSSQTVEGDRQISIEAEAFFVSGSVCNRWKRKRSVALRARSAPSASEATVCATWTKRLARGVSTPSRASRRTLAA